jgi:hypothetical protein
MYQKIVFYCYVVLLSQRNQTLETHITKPKSCQTSLIINVLININDIFSRRNKETHRSIYLPLNFAILFIYY